MKKTLVIVIHPDMDNSRINSTWTTELQKYPDRYTVHNLHARYPDEKIDINHEQHLVAAHDNIVFQFPFYWFNCPPLLKKWLDEVLTHGWAYGRDSEYNLAGKKVALAITAGIYEPDYRATGRYKYTLQQLTSPFEITFAYVRADYRDLFAFYGAEHDPAIETVEENARDYIRFLEAL